MIAAIAIILILIYLVLIGCLTYGFNKTEDFILQDLPPQTKFSIIIPFRNEAENLSRLLLSIAALNYPKSMFEVILINDESEDQSVHIIEKFIKNIKDKSAR